MIKQSVLDKIHQYFPNVKIAYKDQSLLMKILGILLFFIPSFMASYTTTIGDTIYYSSAKFIDSHIASTFITLLHEVVHINDEKRLGKLLFSASYLLPQLFILLAIPFAFIIGWWSLLFLLFLAPIPAFFRMLLEKRAYLASLYVMKKLNDKCGYNIDLNYQSQFFVEQFKNSAYYWMWPFNNLDNEFAMAITKIQNGDRPYNDKVFDILDEIIVVY